MKDILVAALLLKKIELLESLLVLTNKSQLVAMESDLDQVFNKRALLLAQLEQNDSYLEAREKELGVLAKNIEKDLCYKLENLLTCVLENNRNLETLWAEQQSRLEKEIKQVDKEFDVTKYLPTSKKRPQHIKMAPTWGNNSGIGQYLTGVNHENSKALQSKRAAL